MSIPRVYLFCDDEKQRNAIEDALGSRCDIAFAGGLEEMPDSFDDAIPILVDLTGSENSDLSTVLKLSKCLVINTEILEEFDELQLRAWERKVLAQLAGEDRKSAGLQKLPNFWVLCSSTNGPATVGEFLSSIPADTGDSFMLLQHLKDSFIKSLREMLMRSTTMHVVASARSERIKPNTVYICPPSRTPRVADGRIYWDKKRSSKFSPCIDESLESLSESFGHGLRTIVFTGMGTDCLRGCRAVSKAGGSVWAQSIESATMPSMPRSVIEAGLASEVGDVPQLANAFSEMQILR